MKPVARLRVIWVVFLVLQERYDTSLDVSSRWFNRFRAVHRPAIIAQDPL
jgi:hypothetical protein